MTHSADRCAADQIPDGVFLVRVQKVHFRLFRVEHDHALHRLPQSDAPERLSLSLGGQKRLPGEVGIAGWRKLFHLRQVRGWLLPAQWATGTVIR